MEMIVLCYFAEIRIIEKNRLGGTSGVFQSNLLEVGQTSKSAHVAQGSCPAPFWKPTGMEIPKPGEPLPVQHGSYGEELLPSVEQ